MLATIRLTENLAALVGRWCCGWPGEIPRGATNGVEQVDASLRRLGIQALALGVVPGRRTGQPADSAVGAASTDSVVPAATGSATGTDSVTRVGRTTITGQWACNTHCRPTEPISMLAKPPRPR